MKRWANGAIVASFCVCLSTVSLAVPVQYDFALKPAQSGLNATVSVNFTSGGTLIGDYNADTNPNGTRTKPGIFGSFGATENLSVAITLGVGVNGHPMTRSSGGFRMTFDPALGVASISDYAVNLLADGPEALTASVSLQTESFRTRNPTSVYPGNVPITIPVGQLMLNSLTATQVGAASPGVLTPTGPNEYDFVVTPLVQLAGSIDVLGTMMDLPGTPTLLPITGHLVVSGDTAEVTSMQPLDLSQAADPNIAIPQQTLALPTVLPPGQTANVLLDLTLDHVTATVSGMIDSRANGVLVPEPGTVVMGLVGALILALRRKS